MRQGQTMGVAESYMSLGRIVGPLWGGAVFDLNYFMPFISGALVFLVASLAVIVIRGKLQPGKSKEAKATG